MPQLLPICLSIWPLINILIYEEQVIDFKHVSTELCSHLLHLYLTSTKPSELWQEAPTPSGTLRPKIVLAPLPVALPLGSPQWITSIKWSGGQEPVEAKASALSWEKPYSNTPYLICDTCMHACVCMCVKQSRRATVRAAERQPEISDGYNICVSKLIAQGIMIAITSCDVI